MKVDLFLGLVVGLLLVVGAVHTTAARNPSPFGTMFRGRYGRNAVSGLAGPSGPQELPGGPPGAIDLHQAQSPTSDTPSTISLPATHVNSYGGGATYIRWGRSSCPTVAGTEEVYNGVTAGSFFTHPGGGSNYICMVKDGKYQSGAVVHGGAPTFIYGTEYETIGRSLASLHDHNVPCAACHVNTRSAQFMIPGTVQCPSGWTAEYTGWLMSAYYGHAGRTMFVCVDKDAKAAPGLVANNNGALMYHSTVDCNYPGIPCPPYVQQMDLACVVCTK